MKTLTASKQKDCSGMTDSTQDNIVVVSKAQFQNVKGQIEKYSFCYFLLFIIFFAWSLSRYQYRYQKLDCYSALTVLEFSSNQFFLIITKLASQNWTIWIFFYSCCKSSEQWRAKYLQLGWWEQVPFLQNSTGTSQLTLRNFHVPKITKHSI